MSINKLYNKIQDINRDSLEKEVADFAAECMERHLVTGSQLPVAEFAQDYALRLRSNESFAAAVAFKVQMICREENRGLTLKPTKHSSDDTTTPNWKPRPEGPLKLNHKHKNEKHIKASRVQDTSESAHDVLKAKFKEIEGRKKPWPQIPTAAERRKQLGLPEPKPVKEEVVLVNGRWVATSPSGVRKVFTSKPPADKFAREGGRIQESFESNAEFTNYFERIGMKVDKHSEADKHQIDDPDKQIHKHLHGYITSKGYRPDKPFKYKHGHHTNYGHPDHQDDRTKELQLGHYKGKTYVSSLPHREVRESFLSKITRMSKMVGAGRAKKPKQASSWLSKAVSSTKQRKLGAGRKLPSARKLKV